MSERDPELYVADIRIAIDHIAEYTADITFDQFRADQKTIDAVIRNLEIIGEAATHLTEDERSRYQDVPWHLMVSLRNKVIHEYFGVDLAILWQTVQEDLPALRRQIAGDR
jgi:uncharacterized protein with HEPN domain